MMHRLLNLPRSRKVLSHPHRAFQPEWFGLPSAVRLCLVLFFLGLGPAGLIGPAGVEAEAGGSKIDSGGGQAEQSYSRKILHKLAKDVVKFELSNGLRVLLYRRTQAPVFFGNIWIKVGSVNEQVGTTGVSHMLEHMAFKGSTTIGTKDYKREQKLLRELEEVLDRIEAGAGADADKSRLQELQTQLEELVVPNEFSRIYQERGGVHLNAATGKDYTNYEISLPNVGLELWCWLESDRLLNPVFRQFYKERAVIGEERYSRVDDNPQGRIYETLLATAYQAHPNRLPTIGFETDIRALRVRDIEELYGQYYRPDNMVIALVGDIDIAKARVLLERYFGRLPKRSDPMPVVKAVEPRQQGERTAEVEFDAEPQFMAGYHKPVFPNHDDLHFSSLHSVLQEGRSSMFPKVLVREKQLATWMYSTEVPGELFPSLFLVGGSPRKGVSNEQLLDETQKMLDEIKRNGVPAEALAAAKKRLKVDLINLIDSNNGLAETLAHAELIWGDWEKLFEMYDVMLSTTNEDIKRVASTYLTVPNRTVVTLVRPPLGVQGGDAGEQEVRK